MNFFYLDVVNTFRTKYVFVWLLNICKTCPFYKEDCGLILNGKSINDELFDFLLLTWKYYHITLLQLNQKHLDMM